MLTIDPVDQMTGAACDNCKTRTEPRDELGTPTAFLVLCQTCQRELLLLLQARHRGTDPITR